MIIYMMSWGGGSVIDSGLAFVEAAGIDASTACSQAELFQEYLLLEQANELLQDGYEQSLYTEDGMSNAIEKGKAIAHKAWDKIKAFLKSILDKIFGMFKKKKIDPNATYAVPEAYVNTKNRSKLQSVIGQLKRITKTTPVKVILAIISAIAIVVGLYKVAKKGRTNNTSQGSTTPKPQPMTQPKPQPMTQPKPQPMTQPKPQPMTQPKPQPMTQSKPQPMTHRSSAHRGGRDIFAGNPPSFYNKETMFQHKTNLCEVYNHAEYVDNSPEIKTLRITGHEILKLAKYYETNTNDLLAAVYNLAIEDTNIKMSKQSDKNPNNARRFTTYRMSGTLGEMRNMMDIKNYETSVDKKVRTAINNQSKDDIRSAITQLSHVLKDVGDELLNAKLIQA